MLKFDIFSMRVALGCLASAARVCPGVGLQSQNQKSEKRLRIKQFLAIIFQIIKKFPCIFTMLSYLIAVRQSKSLKFPFFTFYVKQWMIMAESIIKIRPIFRAVIRPTVFYTLILQIKFIAGLVKSDMMPLPGIKVKATLKVTYLRD